MQWLWNQLSYPITVLSLSTFVVNDSLDFLCTRSNTDLELLAFFRSDMVLCSGYYTPFFSQLTQTRRQIKDSEEVEMCVDKN